MTETKVTSQFLDDLNKGQSKDVEMNISNITFEQISTSSKIIYGDFPMTIIFEYM